MAVEVGAGVDFFFGFFIVFGLIIAGALTFAILESAACSPLPSSALALLPRNTTTSAMKSPAPRSSAETRSLLATSCLPNFAMGKVMIESTICRHWIT